MQSRDFNQIALLIQAKADREENLFNKFHSQILVARSAALAMVTTDAQLSVKTSKSNRDDKIAAHDLFDSREYRLRNPVEQTKELHDAFNAFPRADAKAKITSPTVSRTYILPGTPKILSAESVDLIPDESTDTDKQHYERTLEQKSDISVEINLLKEIKDIRFELNILHQILTEQKSVTDKLFSPLNRLKMNRDVQDYYLEQSRLERRIQDVVKMDRDAGRTYSHVSISLPWTSEYTTRSTGLLIHFCT